MGEQTYLEPLEVTVCSCGAQLHAGLGEAWRPLHAWDCGGSIRRGLLSSCVAGDPAERETVHAARADFGLPPGDR